MLYYYYYYYYYYYKVILLQTAHYRANAGVLFGARVGRRVAFETIKLILAKVLCTIFDINYHPKHRPFKHARGICNSPYVGPYSYGELNYCDRLHILIILSFISFLHCLHPHTNLCWHGPPLVEPKIQLL